MGSAERPSQFGRVLFNHIYTDTCEHDCVKTELLKHRIFYWKGWHFPLFPLCFFSVFSPFPPIFCFRWQLFYWKGWHFPSFNFCSIVRLFDDSGCQCKKCAHIFFPMQAPFFIKNEVFWADAPFCKVEIAIVPLIRVVGFDTDMWTISWTQRGQDHIPDSGYWF